YEFPKDDEFPEDNEFPENGEFPENDEFFKDNKFSKNNKLSKDNSSFYYKTNNLSISSSSRAVFAVHVDNQPPITKKKN
ncbi:21513_t:CDS:1, partial [Dentiscutata erythropus]